jgi:hypothetical protein
MFREILNESFNAETIIQQLGGFGKLQAMVGAINFIYSNNDKYIAFKFKGSKKVNYVKITLNGKDLYDIEFKKLWGNKIKDIDSYNDVYAENLKPLFEKVTGLFLSL